MAASQRGRVLEHDEPHCGGEAGVVALLRARRARPVVKDAAHAHRAQDAPKAIGGRPAGLRTAPRPPSYRPPRSATLESALTGWAMIR